MLRTSRGAAIDSPMPPNRLPLSPDRSRKPKCSLAWSRTSTRIAPPLGVLGQEVERLALGGACRLVHQRPQTGDLLQDPLAPQKVQPGRQDGGLDHRVLRPVEAGEVTRAPFVDDASEEAPPIFAEVLRLDDELLPGAGVFEDPGAHPVRRPVRRCERVDRAAREQQDVVGEIDYAFPGLQEVFPGHGRPEGSQQHPPAFQGNPHRREVRPPVPVDRRADGLEYHRLRSICTSTCPTRGSTNLRTRTTARRTGNRASTRSRTPRAAASTRWNDPASSSPRTDSQTSR